MAFYKCIRPDSHIHILLFPQHCSCHRACTNHPTVPGNQYLVVLVKPGAVNPVLIQSSALLIFSASNGVTGAMTDIAAMVTIAPRFLTNLLIIIIFQQVGYAPAFKITMPCYSILPAKVPARFLSQYLPYLLPGKYIVFSFHTIAVRVLTAVKASLGICKLPPDIFQNLFRHTPIHLPPGASIGFDVSHDKQAVVVEHFLKVWHQPLPVRGISGKSASNVVKDTAPVHLHQGFLCHGQCLRPLLPCAILHQKYQIVGGGKLGRASKTAVFTVKTIRQLPECLVHRPKLRLSLPSCPFLAF